MMLPDLDLHSHAKLSLWYYLLGVNELSAQRVQIDSGICYLFEGTCVRCMVIVL